MFAKKTQLLPVFILIFFILNNGNRLLAQNNYFPNQTVWTVGSSTFGIPLPQVYTALCGDTVINNVAYQKVYSLTESSNGGYLKTFDYGMREAEQKIWKFKENTETLLYDFSLMEGDTFPVNENGLLINLIVESVSSELIHGVQRKKIKFQNVNGFPGETWYEGIGSNRGFSKRGTGYATDGATWLCCLKIDNELMYPNTPFSQCDCVVGDIDDLGLNCLTTTSTENKKTDNQFVKLFPNPSHGFITIQTDSDVARRMEIYNVTGQLIQAKNIQQNERVNLNTFHPGVYFVKIIDLDKNQFQIKKLILH